MCREGHKEMADNKQIAVLADIHGNYIALQKCVEYVRERGIDTFLFLGDYVGELAYPQRTMELLYELQEKYHCYFIKGNKEDYWIHYHKIGGQDWKEIDSTTGSMVYTYRHLSEKDIEFFGGLSHVREIMFKGLPAITICHGSPRKANEKMLPDDEKTFAILEENTADYILCGHTHVQGRIRYKNKVAYNPGSVGVSLHGNGRAQFMILHGAKGEWTEEFVSLAYDVQSVIRELYEEELHIKAPCWCRVTENLLLTGETPHGSVLARAMQLCTEDMGECNWPNIPEKYWWQAVKEMIEL